MKIKRFSLIKAVLCMAALTMVMASPAFAVPTPTVDGKIGIGEYTESFSVSFEVEGVGPISDTGKLWYYQDSTSHDLFMAFIQPKTLVDNIYGPGTPVDYGEKGDKQHKFTDLLGSDKAQFKLKNTSGDVAFDISFDYLYTDDEDNPNDIGSGFASNSSSYDKYDTKLGDTKTKVYQEEYPGIEVETSMQYNWDHRDDVGVGYDSTNFGKDSSSPNADPDWIYDVIYEIWVAGSLVGGAFDINNFSIPIVHDSPNKIGKNEVYPEIKPKPVSEPATMLLLGCGLIGLAGIGRKKLFRK